MRVAVRRDACNRAAKQASDDLFRALATFVAILVRDRGVIGAAAFLRELAATLDRLVAIRGY